MSAESDLLFHCSDNFGDFERELLNQDLFEGVTVPDFDFEGGDFFKTAINDDRILPWNNDSEKQQQQNVQNVLQFEDSEDTMHRMHRLSLDTIDKTAAAAAVPAGVPAPPNILQFSQTKTESEPTNFLQFSRAKTESETTATAPVLLGYPNGITFAYTSVNSVTTAAAAVPAIVTGSPSLNQVPLVSVSAPLNLATSSAEVLSNGDELLLDNAKSVQFSAASRSSSALDLGSFVGKGSSGSEDLLSPLPTYLQRSSHMQRSFSSHSLDQLRAGSHGFTDSGFHPQMSSIFSSVAEVPAPESRLQTQLQTQLSDLHGVNRRSSFKSMRRVYSTGDLQTLNGININHGNSSPLASEASTFDEAGFKIGRYSAEERKQRIYRYRKKRNERNFNKKIKYACRKTLADSRPRVRGRFARNEDTGDATAKSHHEEEDDDEGDAVHEDDDDFMVNHMPTIHRGEMFGMIPLGGNNNYPFLGFSS